MEGLLCNTCPGVPAAMLEQFQTITEPGSTKTHMLPRSAWKLEIASDEDWEALRELFYLAFFDDFYWYDLLFIDQAIDWLKSGKVCEAAVCNKLPENATHRLPLKFRDAFDRVGESSNFSPVIYVGDESLLRYF